VSRILIPYGTTEGQTAKIAEVIAEVLRVKGHEADLVDIKSLGDSVPDGYDAAIIGASIHMGKHDKHVVDFVQKNLDTLARLHSAFFSVSLAAYGDTQEAEGYVDQFEVETGWRPDKVALLGGALLYTRYGFIKRHMMKRSPMTSPATSGRICPATTSTPNGTPSKGSPSTSPTSWRQPRHDAAGSWTTTAVKRDTARPSRGLRAAVSSRRALPTYVQWRT
jgi:menaquinone-dependent protoporphyrinogen oxidase